MQRVAIVSLILVLSASFARAQSKSAKSLDIYVIDVEGGNAVLFVAPSGESMLVDTGNGGDGAVRDAGRIMAAVKDAGVKHIDHLIITHYHNDHIGGLAELARQISIKEFIDHGANSQPNPNIDPVLQRYSELYREAKHTVAKPGDKIAIAGLEWRIVASDGKVLKTALPGAGAPNPFCASFKHQDVPQTEDDHSVGSFVTFGKFHTVILGDLTLNRQFDLMCPNNRLGSVDLDLLARHGNLNSELLVYPLHPRAAIMNDGTRKGAPPDAMKVLFSSPMPLDVWEMHFSLLSGQEYTVPGMFIANTLDEPLAAIPIAPQSAPPQGQQAPPPPQHNGTAYYFKIAALQDGTFTVTNTRNGFSKTYKAEAGRGD
jgi:beta-lactamase superfamily II metal-dependent hydrolase